MNVSERVHEQHRAATTALRSRLIRWAIDAKAAMSHALLVIDEGKVDSPRGAAVIVALEALALRFDELAHDRSELLRASALIGEEGR